MNLHIKMGSRTLLAGVAIFLASATAHAQATRTWVSGVGDDVNPCSRTAPCKTFAGAISKTAAGGEINAIDSGGFGAVTITKSITIDGTGVLAGILASSTTGVVINGAGIDVVLRNLSINGGPPTSPGVNGIRFLNGNSLTVEKCVITNFRGATVGSGNGNGIVVDTATVGTFHLNIFDSTITNNGIGDEGGGVRIRPTGATTFVMTTIRNSDISQNNGYGVKGRDRTFTTINDAHIVGNTRSGVNLTTTGTLADLVVHDSTLNDNGAVNAGSEGNVLSNGANAFVFLSGNAISEAEMGVRRLNGGHVNSVGDNRMMGNTADGTTDGVVTSL